MNICLPMKKPLRTILFLFIFLLIDLNVCLAQPRSPMEVVQLFHECYGSPCMDEISDCTTANFRKNRPKSVRVVDIWRALKRMKYKKLSSSVIDSKVKDDKAVVLVEARIKTADVEKVQKETFSLIKRGKEWLIDDLRVTDEEIDLKQFKL